VPAKGERLSWPLEGANLRDGAFISVPRSLVRARHPRPPRIVTRRLRKGLPRRRWRFSHATRPVLVGRGSSTSVAASTESASSRAGRMPWRCSAGSARSSRSA